MRRKWRLISHADTINPFLASLVNHESKIKLTTIALGNQTLIEWQGMCVEASVLHRHKQRAVLHFAPLRYQTMAAGQVV